MSGITAACSLPAVLAYRDAVPPGIRERRPLRSGNYELRRDMAKSLTVRDSRRSGSGRSSTCRRDSILSRV